MLQASVHPSPASGSCLQPQQARLLELHRAAAILTPATCHTFMAGFESTCYCCLLQAAAKDAEKLPNEVQLGCYTVCTHPVKGAIERQMKDLREEMLASLRHKVRQMQGNSMAAHVLDIMLHIHPTPYLQGTW